MKNKIKFTAESLDASNGVRPEYSESPLKRKPPIKKPKKRPSIK